MDVDSVIYIWSKILEILTLILVGMIIYRFSIFKKLSEGKVIKKQVETDSLTGRGNRMRFLKDIDSAISIGKKFAVCFFDLDGFKHINDTMGHDAGDKLLIKLAEALEKSLPKNCNSYRLGGDEFGILIKDINTAYDISKVLDKLKKDLLIPINISGADIVLEYSLGISIYPTDGVTQNELIAYADDAMYYIKEHGKNSYYFHNSVLKAKLNNKKKMETDLKASYKKDDFDVEFQPRINLKNLDEIYLETFIFWNHPVLGKLNSEYFIKQAEEIGVIIHLDEIVLRKVCEKIKKLNENNIRNVKFGINISNAHSKRHDFVDKICEIIKEYNIEDGQLQIEVNNTIDIKNMQNYRYIITKLKELGVSICISNYEVKYDMLKIFKQLDIDEVKINSGYINDNDFKKDTFENLIKLSNSLNFSTSIICIENNKDIKESIKGGANKIQGNYLAGKILFKDLDKFIALHDEFKYEIKKKIEGTK